MKKLVKEGILKSFRVNLNLPKLGLNHYKLDIFLKEHKVKTAILKFLENKPYTEYMNFTLGWADLEPEFVVKNVDELMKIMEEINSKFTGSIKKQSFTITEKLHKLRCIPDIKF